MVLDAQPLLILFHRQPHWQYVDRLLEETLTSGQVLQLSAINFGEIYYSVLRNNGETVARETLERIELGPIDIVLPTREQVLLAARLKAGGGISYADCFAAALAISNGVPVVTGDPEFQRLKPFGLQILWDV